MEKFIVEIKTPDGKVVTPQQLRESWRTTVKEYEEAKRERDDLSVKLEVVRTKAANRLSDLLMLQSVSRNVGLNFEMPKQRKGRKSKKAAE